MVLYSGPLYIYVDPSTKGCASIKSTTHCALPAVLELGYLYIKRASWCSINIYINYPPSFTTHVCLFVAYTRENNYLYAIPLKEIYTEKIKIGVKSSLLPYHIPYTKGCHLFCTAPLDGQFLRVAVAVKTKVYMLAYKHPANLTVNGSPITPLKSPKPLDNFIKHRVRIDCDRDMLYRFNGPWSLNVKS